jgi:uncharacterized protein
MLADIILIAKDHGIALAFAGVLLWLFNKSGDRHAEERREWRKDSKKMSEETTSVVRENNQVIRELIRVISATNRHRD